MFIIGETCDEPPISLRFATSAVVFETKTCKPAPCQHLHLLLGNFSSLKDMSQGRQVFTNLVNLGTTYPFVAINPGCRISPEIFFDLFCFPSPASILPLPFHAACYLQHFGAGTFHFACYLKHFGTEPSMLHAVCSILALELFILHAICHIWAQEPSCYLPHLRAGTFQFACYL